MINPDNVDLIIFDMDGTIVPSLEIVYEALQRAFKEFGWELRYSAEDINQFIGTVSGELYQHIIPPEHSHRWEEIRDRTRAEYGALFRESATTFPGVKETLDTLRKRGFRLALYSNASTQYFDIVLTSLQIRDYFDYAECVRENDLTKPELVRKIKEKLNSTTTAVVGDRFHDIDAARETNSLAIGVLFGYGGKEPQRADITIGQFDELLDIFDRKLPVFQKILAEINKRKKADRSFVVGITGIDGAGKTRFAASFEKFLTSRNYQTQTIHLDDFHYPRAVRYVGKDLAENYYRRSFNLDALINKILKPLRQKAGFSTRLSVLNLRTDAYDTEKEYTFHPTTIVIFEGVFLFKEELAPYLDYTIFLEIPSAESLRRAEDRDSPEVINKYETKYLPTQEKYLTEYPPGNHADMIISNLNWEYPAIIKIR